MRLVSRSRFMRMKQHFIRRAPSRSSRRAFMFSTRRLRVAAGLAVSALVAVVAVSAGTSANTQAAKLVIWADADRVPAVTQVATAWGRSKGVTVQVVQKQSGPIRQEVSTV